MKNWLKPTELKLQEKEAVVDSLTKQAREQQQAAGFTRNIEETNRTVVHARDLFASRSLLGFGQLTVLN